MPATLPHRYSTSLYRTYASPARTDAPRPVPHRWPPEPACDPDARSPEHMLLASLGLCMLSTFEAFAARDGIELVAWRAQVSGTVEQTPEGPNFTSIVVELDIDIDGNADQFENALEDAKRCCLVQNALRVPVVVETQIHAPGLAAGDLADLADLRPPPPRDVRGQLRAV